MVQIIYLVSTLAVSSVALAVAVDFPEHQAGAIGQATALPVVSATPPPPPALDDIPGVKGKAKGSAAPPAPPAPPAVTEAPVAKAAKAKGMFRSESRLFV